MRSTRRGRLQIRFANSCSGTQPKTPENKQPQEEESTTFNTSSQLKFPEKNIQHYSPNKNYYGT
eukprot:3801520-Amphidinium_carterae.1